MCFASLLFIYLFHRHSQFTKHFYVLVIACGRYNNIFSTNEPYKEKRKVELTINTSRSNGKNVKKVIYMAED